MPESEDRVQPLVVRLPADLHAALKERSRNEERTMAQTVRHAVKRYLAEPANA